MTIGRTFVLGFGTLVAGPALACSVFAVADAEGVRMGRNLDWYPDTSGQVWVEPPGADTYGVLFFGVEHEGFAQDGVNDQGLAMGAATIPAIELTSHPDRPDASWDLLMDVLRTCATVDEAVALIEAHDLSGYPSIFSQGHILLVDATGASAVIEGDTILFGDGAHQVMTNFCLSAPELGYWPCPRYDLLEEGLSGEEPLTDEAVTALVEAARGSAWGGFTVYSEVYDLDAMTVTLFWESDFEHPIRLDILEATEVAGAEQEMEALWQAACEADAVDVPFGDPPAPVDEASGSCAHTRAGWLAVLACAPFARRRRERAFGPGVSWGAWVRTT